MDYLLVYQVSYHPCGGHANNLVVPFVSSLELYEDSFNDQLHYSGQLCVDHGDERRVYVSEVGRGHLSFHHCSREETLTSKQVLVKELEDDVLDV